MNNNRGFTIIEVVIVMIVMGIAAALAAVKYQKTMAANELEKAANSLYMELRGLRPLCFKYDDTVKVIFNPTATPPSLTTWIYDSSDPTPAYKEKSTYKISSPVKIGLPSTDGPNGAQPFTDSWWSANKGTIVNGLQIEWKTALKVVPDSRGEYDHGGVYLYNPRLKGTTYFIGISSAIQSIQLLKWDGSWRQL